MISIVSLFSLAATRPFLCGLGLLKIKLTYPYHFSRGKQFTFKKLEKPLYFQVGKGRLRHPQMISKKPEIVFGASCNNIDNPNLAAEKGYQDDDQGTHQLEHKTV